MGEELKYLKFMQLWQEELEKYNFRKLIFFYGKNFFEFMNFMNLYVFFMDFTNLKLFNEIFLIFSTFPAIEK